MKLQAIKDIFHRELDLLYPKEEVNSFFYLITEHYLGIERFILVLDPNFTITKKQEQPFFEALSKLRQEYPIQYILGESHFMDMELMVNEDVLIPRPETEELVLWILEDEAKTGQKPKRVLDIGTGSGCIAISLAKNWPEAAITATDVSAGALEIARRNASRHKVDLEFIEADIFEYDPRGRQWDIMVSNPPYIRQAERENIRINVKKYEPGRALFVPDESPLLFYERIFELASRQLLHGGKLYVEINQYLGGETAGLLRAKNFSDIELRKDMFGNERMLRGSWP